MKKTKKPRRRKRPVTVYLPPTRVTDFPEVKGKTIEDLKLYPDDDTTLQLRFTDRTDLSFDLEPGLTVRTFLYDAKVENALPTKIWPPLQRASSWVKEPAEKKSKPHH
jgi:hypothetical protein